MFVFQLRLGPECLEGLFARRSSTDWLQTEGFLHLRGQEPPSGLGSQSQQRQAVAMVTAVPMFCQEVVPPLPHAEGDPNHPPQLSDMEEVETSSHSTAAPGSLHRHIRAPSTGHSVLHRCHNVVERRGLV